jgi:parvulin-like peptidyl-prolyl isomerase
LGHEDIERMIAIRHVFQSAFFFLVLLGPAFVLAKDYPGDTVVIARGDYALTLDELDARMSRFPAPERAQFVRDPANMARLLDKLLVDNILSAEAKELGIDSDPLIRRDMELAVREVLATHRMNRFFGEERPDFDQLARERYLVDPAAYALPEQLTVDHVLVSTQNRTEEEARVIAERVRSEALASSDAFSGLIEEYSEDPSKKTNQGRFIIDDPEIYAPEFVEGARTLVRVGEISDLVKTSFGFHIIRLVERRESKPQSFEEVREALVRRVARDYGDNVRIDYLASVRSRFPESGNEDVLRSLPARYGGRPEDANDSPPPESK